MKELKIHCMIYADIVGGESSAAVLDRVVRDMNDLEYSINIFETTVQECEE